MQRRSAHSARWCCRCSCPASSPARFSPSPFRSRTSSSPSSSRAPTSRLPIYVYSSIRRGVTPEINAIGTIVLMTSFTLLIAAQLILRDRTRRRAGAGG